MFEYAVVDVETTGFDASRNDRIIEIAIVRTDAAGSPTARFESLVNPQREINPASVHGITPADIQDAPRFDEIAGDVVESLRGCVLVAHNVRFDQSFLLAEMRRAGVDFPQAPWLCTMYLSREYCPSAPRRSLAALCDALNIDHEKDHSALSDALATAGLLSRLLKCYTPGQVRCLISPLPGEVAWPAIMPSGKRRPRSNLRANASLHGSFVARLFDRLPSIADDSPDVQCYLDVLERAMLDRIITEEESIALGEVAVRHGLFREQVALAHERYYAALCRAAQADGVITRAEQTDLENVRRMLHIAYERADAIFRALNASVTHTLDVASAPALPSTFFAKTVCFTGECSAKIGGRQITRALAESIAARHGVLIKHSVSSKVDYLIAPDINTQSAKAARARQLHIPIVPEMDFWRSLGLKLG